MRKLTLAIILAVLLGGLVLAGGCGTPKTGPQIAFEKFDDAARDGDYQAVYDLLSAKFQAQLSLEDVKNGLNPPGAIKITGSSETGDTGFVTYEDPKTGQKFKVLMVKENGLWKVDELVVESTTPGPPGSEPESAPVPGGESAPVSSP